MGGGRTVKLGVLTVLYQQISRTDALDRIAGLGIDAVELGTGNYPGSQHCDPDELLGDQKAITQLKKDVESRGLMISALSCHGNPLHPDDKIATEAHETWRKTAQLANALEVPVVNLFSGCPGDGPDARFPNWVTCAWPEDFPEILEWQWNEKVVPYWQAEAAYATEQGVKVAFEMHPGFVVYNPETLIRLRDAAGDVLGANFDPSHLYWQGIDPVAAIRQLGSRDAIFHVHAKDTRIDEDNTKVNGVLDTKGYDRVLERSWVFRTVGYGHGETSWRDQISALRAVGYDYVLSIEHEDSLMSIDEGLQKAVEFLRPLVIREQPTDMWWA
jgi:sugar phosphate isomerase/epimerase